MHILLPEFKKLLSVLNKHKVDYMLIGGYAVIFYGFERITNDMDIWLRPDDDNKRILINALKEFGIGNESLATVSNLNFSEAQTFFIGERPRRIDFLTKITGITYHEASPKVNYLPIGDDKIPVIHYHHLILSKISNERPKDKIDVEELQRINKFKSNDK